MIEALPSASHIGYAHLAVSNMATMRRFYSDLLGFQVLSEAPQRLDLSADGQHLHLRLSTCDHPLPRQPGTTGLFHIAFRLPDRKALGRLFNRLSEQAVPLQGASDHLVSEAVYLSDPEGNGLELYRDRPRQDWPWHGDQLVMSTDPLDWRSLLAEGIRDDAPWRGIDPGADIGHIHLQVSALSRAEAFYSKTIGLQVMQRTYPGALFMSAGGYHHHVAVNIWGVKSASPPANAPGLREFSLVVPDASARQVLRTRLQAAGAAYQEIDTGTLFFDPDGIGLVI